MSPQACNSRGWVRYVSLLGLLGLCTGLALIAAGLCAGVFAFLSDRLDLTTMAAFLICTGAAQAVVSMLILKALIKFRDGA